MMAPAQTTGRRGGPLVVLVLLITVWTGTRAVWWENPFAKLGEVLGQSLAVAGPGPAPLAPALPKAHGLMAKAGTHAAAMALPASAKRFPSAGLTTTGLARRIDPQIAAARQFIWFAALRETVVHSSEFGRGAGFGERLAVREAPPFLPAAPRSAGGRWSLDAWAFWRQGSGSAPISQGRVPIYGASQVGAVLQYRLAPDAGRDPRLYARAYRALVQRGEQELALGASVRPVGRLPVRVAAEVRYTDAAFTNEVRPSAYAATEFAPVVLPFAMQLDAYGQAGWVGGASATAFADGQASVTRGVRAVAAASDDALRLSVGAGAWGGAQMDAQRFDIGPTMRLDLTVGDVPARLSLDWRERVAGQAGPDSGLAATLSTRF